MTSTTKAGAARTEPGLLKRLAKGPVICAEGYVFELERRGYLQAGAFVPIVLTEHPEVVEELHLDFARAGSDVTLALTYYVHREKLRVIGRERDLAPMNHTALRIAALEEGLRCGSTTDSGETGVGPRDGPSHHSIRPVDPWRGT